MKYIYEPIALNQLKLKNRIVLPPMASGKTPDGKVTEALRFTKMELKSLHKSVTPEALPAKQ